MINSLSPFVLVTVKRSGLNCLCTTECFVV